VASLGIVSSCFVHVLAAAFGVGALLAYRQPAFTLLKWGGAAYLVWMGWEAPDDREGGSPPHRAASGLTQAPQPANLRHAAWFPRQCAQPQVALFCHNCARSSRRPNKVQPARPDLQHQLFAIEFGYAWLAAKAAQRMEPCSAPVHWLDRVGFDVRGLWLKLAMSDSPLLFLERADAQRSKSRRRKPCSAPSNTAKSSTTQDAASCA
jgi:hypothetical protein